jgi:hypothetical protein
VYPLLYGNDRGRLMHTDQALPATEVSDATEIRRIDANCEPATVREGRFPGVVIDQVVCIGELPDTHYYYG